jgi:hypothetical protein
MWNCVQGLESVVGEFLDCYILFVYGFLFLCSMSIGEEQDVEVCKGLESVVESVV